MISNKPKRRPNSFCTLDIETAPSGDLLSLCIYNGKECIHFQTWAEFYYFIEQNNKEKTYRKFVAHNGGKFDWVSMVESLIDTFKDVDIIMTGSSIVFIKLKDFKKNVIFLDSLKVLQKGLKKLCKTFEVETPKKEIDISKIEWYFKNEYHTYKEYLERDCISLFQVLEKAMKIFDVDFWPPTIASLSMYKFRESFLPKNLLSPWGKKDEFISQSYAGGRVECFRSGIFNNVYVYDVNSLYPFVMRNADIPIASCIQTRNYHTKIPGFYKIAFNQYNKSVPPVLWEKTENGLEFVYKGSGIFYNREINLLTAVGGTFKLDHGFIYPKGTCKAFKKFVDYYYGQRTIYKGTPLDYCFKILMNSLYGKFAQKCLTHKLVKWDMAKLKANKFPWKEYNLEKNLFEIEETRKVRHRHIAIASIITSLARIALYKYFLLYPDNLIYCDTDSIHLNRSFPEKYVDDKKLGFLKIENENDKGCYIGRKQYAVGDKMKFKGIPLKSSLPHDELLFEDYIELFNNKSINFKYTTFPALKTVLQRNKKACKPLKLSRNIKKADYLTNFRKGFK